MERDFEKEFIELKLSEAPDLWHRIEAGLSEKSMVSSVSGNHSGYGKKDIAKRTAWKKWGTLAAACLCVAIIYPMVSLVLRNMGRDGNYSGSAASDTTAGDIAAKEMTAEDADIMTDAVAAEDSVSEGAVESFDNADVAGNADAAESTAATEAAEDTVQGMEAANGFQSDADKAVEETETKRSDITDMAEEVEKESASGCALVDGQILEDVVVSISGADASGDADLYQAVVLQADAELALASDMQIEIVCDSGTEYAFLREPREKRILKTGDSYILSLRYEEQEGRFTVITAAKEK